MRNRVRDRSAPFKTQIAIARRHWNAGDFGRPHARPMDVKLLVAEPISVAGRPRDQFNAQDHRVEYVRALPIADMNDAVVEFGRDGHGGLRGSYHRVVWQSEQLTLENVGLALLGPKLFVGTAHAFGKAKSVARAVSPGSQSS